LARQSKSTTGSSVSSVDNDNDEDERDEDNDDAVPAALGARGGVVDRGFSTGQNCMIRITRFSLFLLFTFGTLLGFAMIGFGAYMRVRATSSKGPLIFKEHISLGPVTIDNVVPIESGVALQFLALGAVIALVAVLSLVACACARRIRACVGVNVCVLIMLLCAQLSFVAVVLKSESGASWIWAHSPEVDRRLLESVGMCCGFKDAKDHPGNAPLCELFKLDNYSSMDSDGFNVTITESLDPCTTRRAMLLDSKLPYRKYLLIASAAVFGLQFLAILCVLCLCMSSRRRKNAYKLLEDESLAART